MPRVKKGRHASKNKCLSCLVICLIVIVVLTAGVMVGSVLAFNHFISPLIGGVKFFDCLKILNALTHADRNKIINSNEEFTAQDLNDFYMALNSMLYQKELTEEEYLERYEALPEEEKLNMTFEEYKASHPFRIDLEILAKALNLEELLSGGDSNKNNGEVAAAEGENENGEGLDETYVNLIKELYFDFSSLEKYPYFDDEEDFSYTTFQITGKQLASVINEILDIVLNSFNLGDQAEFLGNVNLKNYIGLPVVSFKKVDNKDKLTTTVELHLRKLIDEVVADILMNELNVPKFAINAIKTSLPKNFYITLETYPTDSNSEVTIKINNADDKVSNNIKIITNALTERFNVSLFPSSNANSDEENAETPKKETIFKQLNNKVVDIFSLLNDYVPLTFVSNEEGSATLRIAHIQALLKMAGLFDEDDLENSVTPHMFFTTLRCLFDEATAVSNKEDLISFYAQLDDKYGINKDYWENRSLLDADTLENLPSQIDPSSVEFLANDKMRIFVHEGQLAMLIDDAIKSGFFSSDSSVATAEDEGNSFISKINFEAIRISKTSTQSLPSYKKELKTFKDWTPDVNTEFVIFTNVTEEIYTIDAVLSLTLSDLLSSGEEGNNPLIDTLTKSLPQKLCLALVLNIKDVFDDEGNLVDRVVGAKAIPTTFKINNFDENYSKKVFDIITLMISKFGSDFDFELESITSQIESAFEDVFSSISDTLYFDILFSEKDEANNKNGCLVLPSVYEVVQGLSNKQIDESDTLTDEDRMTKDQIRELFVQIYNTPFLVLEHDEEKPSDTSNFAKVLRKFDPNDGNEFLKRLSKNYYLANPLTSDSLLGEESFELSATSFRFKGEDGLYFDQRNMEELDTALNGSALASIVNGGIDLAELISGEDGSENIIKSLTIVNCEYEWIGEVLVLNVEFAVSFREVANDTAEASEGEGLSLEKLLPEKAYLTACIVLFTDEEGNLYNTDLLLNNGTLDNMSKLTKIFLGGNFETDTLNNQVKESISKTFDTLKEVFNLKYVIGSDDAILFKNVFNTINKLSHNDSETDEEAHLDHVAYEALSEEEKEEDDRKLRELLQEFGRHPAYSEHSEMDGENEALIVDSVDDLRYFSNNPKDIYSLADINEFFDDLNEDFYISDEHLLNADNLDELNSISASYVDFTKLYYDERNIQDIDLFISGNRFTALANKFSGYSISLDSEDSSKSLGTAYLIQSKIGIEEEISFIRIVILVRLTLDDDTLASTLPDYLFLTAKVNLSEVDENGERTYPVDLFINSFGEEETDDTMRRIRLLEKALDFETGFSLDQVKETLSEEIGSVLDVYADIFGGLNVKDDYIDLPNIYEYVTSGTIEPDGHYDVQKPMFETFRLNDEKCVYGIQDGKVGYYQDNNFIWIYARVDGNEQIAEATRNADNVWGYFDNDVFVPIQTLPEQLMEDLRNFGRTIEENNVSLKKGSKLGHSIFDYEDNYSFISKLSEEDIELFRPNNLALASDKDYFFNEVTDANGTYYHDFTSEILDLINYNYYIREEKRITMDDFKGDGENRVFKLNNEMFDFASLYKDKRLFEHMLINVFGNYLASFFHDMYPEGITSEENDNFVANVVQMHIYSNELSENADYLLSGFTTLKTVLRVTILDNGQDEANVLPDYVYMTVYTILDANAGDRRFECEAIINNFGNETLTNSLENRFASTEAFANRLNVLKNNFNVQFEFDLDDIKDTIKEKFRQMFEENLQSFGELKFENDSMVIPNIFQMLTEGQLTEDNEGKMDYLHGIQDEDGVLVDHQMYELDGMTLTSPELLRDRMQEFGHEYSGAIKVRGTSDFYNDNAFTIEDEDLFYSDMQALYFLLAKPTLDDLKNSTILDGLENNIEGTFNLRGKIGAVYGKDIKQNYIDFGLYNYLGEQAELRLSDRALASLIGSQHTISMDSNMMLKDLVITSIKLHYVDKFTTTIEITIKASTRDKDNSTLNAMPDYFFLTTISERTIDDEGNVNYSTRVALNGFTPEEFDSYLANVAHIEQYSSLGITENFNPESIAEAVEKALIDTLDTNLSKYMTGFGNYENDENGFGYVRFKSIYSELLRYTGATVGDEKDMQNVMVKLNNNNEYLTKNAFDDSNAMDSMDLISKSYFNDREFAYLLNSLLQTDPETSYITIEQLVILKGINSEYDGYVDLVKNIKDDFFLTNEDKGYFLITASIYTADITSKVQLAPEKIYVTILLDSEGNFVNYMDRDEEKSVKFIQDFTKSELALFMDIFNDENHNLDLDEKIEMKVKSILGMAKDTTLNQSDNFDEYCGFVGNK